MSGPFYFLEAGRIVERVLPDPCEAVMNDIPWGQAEQLFTPAFWLTQLWMSGDERERHRLGSTFGEEVAACLLGGHGLTAEVGLAAFDRLRTLGLIASLCQDESAIAAALRRPLVVRNRPVVYRFWAQRSRYLVAAFKHLRDQPPSQHSAVALRDYLLEIPGIGLKTSSWVVRNWLDSDDVAVLDVHVVRAGVLMGLFEREHRLPRDYIAMERLFLDLAARMQVSAATLDALIWKVMRQCPDVVANALSAHSNARPVRAKAGTSRRSTPVQSPWT